ncbi:hypothetical protein Scep_003506 [Stephania cephalantha]|uniref:Rapid ALkalinization Factor n=1 Tax=Stephania cephalantha TaxID=152367 RepID=A0AAP0KSM5_9MAGN
MASIKLMNMALCLYMILMLASLVVELAAVKVITYPALGPPGSKPCLGKHNCADKPVGGYKGRGCFREFQCRGPPNSTNVHPPPKSGGDDHKGGGGGHGHRKELTNHAKYQITD